MITQNITKLSVLLMLNMLHAFVHLSMHLKILFYLLVVIKHLIKEVESWQLSMYNDAKWIIDLFVAIKDKIAGSIVHIDHGVNYSSKSIKKCLKKCHAKNQCRALQII